MEFNFAAPFLIAWYLIPEVMIAIVTLIVGLGVIAYSNAQPKQPKPKVKVRNQQTVKESSTPRSEVESDLFDPMNPNNPHASQLFAEPTPSSYDGSEYWDVTNPQYIGLGSNLFPLHNHD